MANDELQSAMTGKGRQRRYTKSNRSGISQGQNMPSDETLENMPSDETLAAQ